jgi:ABC-type branched-subunit amino acid transport system substrate-binding protein
MPVSIDVFTFNTFCNLDFIVGFSDKSQYKYFYRTIPTKVTLVDVMLDFIQTQGWDNIGVIYSNDPFGQQCNCASLFVYCSSIFIFFLVYQKIMSQAAYKKINVLNYQLYLPEELTGILNFISKSAIRIIVVGVTGTNQVNLITKAIEKGLLSNEYVWLLMDDNSQLLIEATHDVNALNGLFLFDMKMPLYGYPPFEAFLDDWTQLDPNS